MKRRILALGLSCLMALSLAVPAAAGRVNTANTIPVNLTDYRNWRVTEISGAVSFNDLEEKIRENNLTVQSFQRTLESMRAMDFEDSIRDIEDAIQDLEEAINMMEATEYMYQQAQDGLKEILNQLGSAIDSMSSPSIPSTPNPRDNPAPDASNPSDRTAPTVRFGSAGSLMGYLYAAIEGYVAAAVTHIYSQMQIESLEANIETLNDQIGEIRDQEEEYFEKTIPDRERQFESITCQLISGAESLYVTILSVQLQKEGLENTLASTDRAMAELELRYELGQIPQLTLAQVETGLSTLETSVDSLDSTLSSLKGSLQSMMGEPATGQLRLRSLPVITGGNVLGRNYNLDLSSAKKNSYDLYTASRTVEDAKDDMDEAQAEEGKNSYQYEMAEKAYEAALLQEEAAIQDFELGFLNLYNSMTPALAAYNNTLTTLEYEEKVYAVEELKYELGNISANSLADAKDTLNTAQRDCDTAQMDLFTAWNSYQQAVKRGLITSASAG